MILPRANATGADPKEEGGHPLAGRGDGLAELQRQAETMERMVSHRASFADRYLRSGGWPAIGGRACRRISAG